MAFSPQLFGAAGMVERARDYLEQFDAYPAHSFESLKRAGAKSGIEWRE